ncbi:MAG: hypothetical protein GVY21_04025 [Gammaproteobacteria bacterium]|jgi:uncharacterized tellurite resistance protein B-like protein|nr:hypothetical protein [Gammaproteobacteria bacterium]
MAIADLSNVLKIFGGSEPTEEERRSLFKEVLLMTLSRATSADANIDTAEVDTVQTILKRTLDEDIDAADIRVAAKSEIYESAPLPDYLASVAKRLESAERVAIARALADVIHSDCRISEREVHFFDMVAKSLKITPAELAGIVAA